MTSNKKNIYILYMADYYFFEVEYKDYYQGLKKRKFKSIDDIELTFGITRNQIYEYLNLIKPPEILTRCRVKDIKRIGHEKMRDEKKKIIVSFD
jgi:hypothetical protein|tara:strand:- start:305 stop:586 length:282 start_codon:yes stop_codon:yes gene_type:complete